VNRRVLGGVVAAIGAAILVVSVSANELGVGDTSSFGWKQTTGAILGGAVIVVGLAVLLFARSPSAPAD
jgi:hypothetical protein